MRAVFKREFRSCILSYAGMAFVGLFLFVSGIFIAYFNLEALSSSFAKIFEYLPIVVAVLLPVIIIGTFSTERRDGTDRLLSMLPLSAKDIVLGKYFSRLAIVMIPNIILAIVPIVLNFGGEVGYASAYSVLVVFSFLEALLLAIGFYIDAHCQKKNASVIVPYAVFGGLLGVSYAIEYIPTQNAVLRVLKEILSNVSLFAQIKNFLFGLLDFRIIFVYVALTVLFVALTVLSFDKEHGSYGHEEYKHTEQYRGARTVSIVLLAAIIFANVGVLLTPDRYSEIDVTAERTYTISDDIKAFIGALDKPVTVYAIDFEADKQTIRHFLDRMASYSKNLTVVDVDTARDTEIVEKYGLAEFDSESILNSIIIESDSRAEILYYSQLFTYTNETLGFSRISSSEWQYYYSMYSSSSDYAQYAELMLTDTNVYFEGQTVLSQYIEYVSVDYIPSPYILGGHGTDVSESFFGYVCSYYGVGTTELILADGDAVPEYASALIIPKPATDLTDSELNAIRDYLARGGQVTVVTDEANLDMPNLMALLAEYGMSAEKGIIMDTATIASEETEESESSENTDSEEENTETEANTEETTSLTLAPNYNHDVIAQIMNAGVTSFTVTNANAITLDSQNNGDLLLTPLLSTAETAYKVGVPDEKSSFVVAATAEKARGDRLVWFTGAESLLIFNEIENVTEQQLSNTLSVIYALSWTNNVFSSGIVSAPATYYATYALEMTETATTAVGTVFVAIIPICFVLPVAIIKYKREKELIK